MNLLSASSRHHYADTLRLGIPIAVGQVGVIVMGFADTMMVGRYATDALAASAFVNNVFTLVTFLIMGYSYGLTPLVSSHFGRGQHHRAGYLLRSALASNTLYGAFLIGLMGVLYFFVDRLGQPAELLPLIRPYYLVVLASMLFVLPFNVLRQFTDGLTRTWIGMWILLGGNLLNIVGNWLLIYGVGPFPELGLLGAGLSTCFSRMAMALVLAAVVAFGRGYRPYRRGFMAGRMTWRRMAHINRHSLPVSLQMGMECGSFTTSAVMAGWLGAVELAAYQVMVTIGTLGFLFYYSMGAAMSIRVASFFGTQDWGRVREAVRAGFHILLVMAAAASVVFLLYARALIGFFSSDPAVLACAMTLVGPLVLYQFGDSSQICFANALRGTGRVVSMMWVAFVSYIVIGIPSCYVMGFVFGWGERGIFLSFSVSLFTAAALFAWRFRQTMGRLPLGNVRQAATGR